MPLKKRPATGSTHKRTRAVKALVAANAEAIVALDAPSPLVHLVAHPTEKQSLAPTPQEAVRALVDKFCGLGGERVIQALAVIALGNAPARYAFFGEQLRVAPKDRVAALNALALRRWGRPTLSVELDPNDTGRMPVQIINVFADLSGSPPDDY